MARKLTQDEFIEKAREVHGDKYDYSKVEYINNKTKVCIICPEHGEFLQTPNAHMKKHGCPKCATYIRNPNPQRVGVEKFKERANIIHGNKYNYSLVNFINTTERIDIICPHHGVFNQVAHEHLRGRGCPQCGKHTISIKNRKDKIYGIAEHDIYINDNGVISQMWRSMLDRCYSKTFHKHHPYYVGCEVCDEWLKLSNFYNWVKDPCNGYKSGYHLDKDILVRNNKVYSPETCCFVPTEINTMFTKTNKKVDSKLSITKYGTFYVRIYSGGKYDKGKVFRNKSDAVAFYKLNKEQNIKNIAEKYFKNGLIVEKVYQALMSYEVKIND